MNMTALHYACLHGHAETVEALCQLGASVVLEDDRNRTCIEIAAYHALGHKYPKVPKPQRLNPSAENPVPKPQSLNPSP